ncbi:predicted protein [Lichtheimia corymbifera JMRC:FSU:9682]|uniref:Uncharacterized protein n=1 Tax=Lichtheimia corymbifera JMRC:FSU:9682 TaxID=1263082 RepID=A0A068RN25_9FUNG|nr:predicted protein [Lichtheimia corymbifera JMRC:FSU:9682]
MVTPITIATAFPLFVFPMVDPAPSDSTGTTLSLTMNHYSRNEAVIGYVIDGHPPGVSRIIAEYSNAH